jgi:hypothetical protein
MDGGVIIMPRITSLVAARRGALAGLSILAAVTLSGCPGTPSTSTSSTSSASTSSASTSSASTSSQPISEPSTSQPISEPSTTSPPTPAVSLALNNGDKVSCRLTTNGAACSMHGTAQGTSGTLVLLWVEPVSPASNVSGYYIQRGGYGVTRQPRPGAGSNWGGTIQIGNSQYPPCQGDTFNVIVTLDDAATAATLIGQSQQTNPDPTQQSLASAEADNVIVSGVPSSCGR